ncbi:LysR family transcriptional regulator [Amycolatopsis mediterranei S699]|uniref:LysR family transcriptional regulator n=2 Tax=Amycolatopsis mediterranei TaxID=33910 RepID=A0A0H3D462_AMYMU|nr:LysR family transcriptional regulator [Amycolatopsis mediterranei]ADJ45456.1 LysR family transcriptional regulator [Amycolatopsis mediterranei U32]AEK42225.1 LysR family transcriptional regulator [Amycolatopsis mediterranei S699]AFO77168.1 LysR family transcriptional regulator [Amycolatopsis mediterranei S699]AGT84296.1 LysR family transcriptional regulator [Amycolatopsis mediterranei RB]KDO06036.1 LysR family transcriptional regulator [Amycolatopsis mediterranei]
MELRHLEHFLAVADAGSFTRAARALHVVQSGVSATVKALERELGSALFTRSRQEVTLTAAGQALLPKARETLDAAQAAKDAVDRTRGALHGTVTVGTLTAIDLVDLPELLAALRARHAGVTVRLRAAMAGSAGLAQHLRDGQLDVAFLALPAPSPADLDTRELATAPLTVYVPGSHPLAGKHRATLAQLAEFPFIDTPPGFGSRAVVDQAFTAAGVQREVTVEVANVGTVIDFVRAGLGIAFLGRPLVSDLTGLDTVQVADCDLRWQLTVATAATRRPSAATEAFLALLRERHPTSKTFSR